MDSVIGVAEESVSIGDRIFESWCNSNQSCKYSGSLLFPSVVDCPDGLVLGEESMGVVNNFSFFNFLYHSSGNETQGM